MSQRENSGSNAPGPSIGASDCPGIAPRASRASCFPLVPYCSSSVFLPRPLFQSRAAGLAHPTIRAASVKVVPGCITPVFVVPRADELASCFIGVGQPDSLYFSFSDSAIRPPDRATVRLAESVFPAALYSFVAGLPAIGVGQPAVSAAA